MSVEDGKDKAIQLLKLELEGSQLLIDDLKDRLVSVKAERDVFQKENHRLMSIMVEKGYLKNA